MPGFELIGKEEQAEVNDAQAMLHAMHATFDDTMRSKVPPADARKLMYATLTFMKTTRNYMKHHT